jgi:VWFA-related protein
MKLGSLALLIAVGGSTPLTGTLVDRNAPQIDQQPPPTFRASADAVAVDASVRRNNRPVTGLTAADFEIVDNGVLQKVTDVSYEKLPIDVTVALDVSASVTGSVLDQLRRSVQQLAADLHAQDRLELQTFNQRIQRLVDFASPASTTDAAVARISAGGGSAVFDTLAVTMAMPATAARRHLIVLFSDGVDSSSISDPEMLFELARGSGSTVAVVLASTNSQAPASVFSRHVPGAITIERLYDRIASDTGGTVVTLSSGDNLATTFRRVLDNFRASYVLYFTPQGVERTGAHTLDVRVKRSNVQVRARSGYVWR